MKNTIQRIVFGTVGLAILASCSKSGVESRVESDSSATIEVVEAVRILTWAEYFNPDIVVGFEESSGLKVEFDYFENLDEMQAKLESRPDGYDLIVTDGGSLADLIELQMLQPIDRRLVPNLKNLDERYLNLTFDPENRFSVPYMWGSTLITYRSDLIPEPAHSWNSLWNEKYKGKVLMVDDQFDCYAVALMSLGYDLNSQDHEELVAATDKLVSLAEELDVEFVDIISIREKLLSGECWISVSYSSDAPVLAEENEAIKYFIPEEGAPLWVDSFVIPKESPNSDGAHKFLNFVADAEVAAENSNYLWCATVNREAKPFLSEEVLGEKTLYPDDETMARCKFDVQQSAARNLIVNRGMKQIYDSHLKSEARQEELAETGEEMRENSKPD